MTDILPGWLRSIGTVVISIFITMFGLLLMTFIISRLLPADPVLAIVSDHASADAIAALQEQVAALTAVVVNLSQQPMPSDGAATDGGGTPAAPMEAL